MEIEIKGDGTLIKIIVHGRENPIAKNMWDKKWLISSIYMNHLSAFTVNFKCSFLIDDLINFKNTIETTINGLNNTVVFRTLEDSMFLKGQVYENIKWEGYFIYPIGDGNKLTFKFESDFAQLENLLSSINNILSSL